MIKQVAADVIDRIKEETARWGVLKQEVKKTIVGQDHIIDRLLVGLLCNGHILLEGVPGLAKTTLVKTLAQALGVCFSRIQFTPDLLPADVIGTLLYNPQTQLFQTKKGPIFANLIIADEINRAPAKVQSALLEAMQEHQVTIGDTSHLLEKPFLVLATQNPIDQEGTYRLPEAQVDRFMFKVLLDYPSLEEEREVLLRLDSPHVTQKVLSSSEIMQAQKIVQQIYVDENVIDYLLALVRATRYPEEHGLSLKQYIAYGASPRAAIALLQASRGYAFLKGRHFVIPDDLKTIVGDILRHRVLLTYEADADGVKVDDIIMQIIDQIPVH
ncbi:MoxR family ATPase [Candidatus Babeliales bacterium]|nr:MoxR family ATPase [Candidatus Babeliales bacterium]